MNSSSMHIMCKQAVVQNNNLLLQSILHQNNNKKCQGKFLRRVNKTHKLDTTLIATEAMVALNRKKIPMEIHNKCSSKKERRMLKLIKLMECPNKQVKDKC